VTQERSTELVARAEVERGAPLVTRLMFVPVKLLARRVAPRVAAAMFEGAWRVVDHTAPPPKPEERQPSVSRLALALALEGACMAVARGLLEQASRRQFARVTGRWPVRPAKQDA